MDSFITAHTDITNPSSREWQHFANLSRKDIRERWLTPQGKGLLNNLKSGNFAKQALADHVGKFSNKYDLRGISLKNLNFAKSDFTDCDFFFADLSGSNFQEANFTDSHLSECNIQGANFQWSILKNTLLDNVKFDYNTQFLGVDFNSINFTLAEALRDLVIQQQRIQQLEQHHPIVAKLLFLTCNYGRSLGRYSFWVILLILIYSGLYYVFFNKSFVDSLVASIITFTTAGFSDGAPETIIQKLIVTSESLISYLMGGLLVAVLAKKVVG